MSFRALVCHRARSRRTKPVFGLAERHRTSKDIRIFRGIVGWAVRHVKLSRRKQWAHDVAVKRDANAKLNFNQKLIKGTINARMRHQSNRPDPAAALFLEVKFGKRLRELMIFFRKLHRLTVAHAAEDGEAIHPVGRVVKPQTCVIRKVRFARELGGIAIAFDHLIERNPRRGRRHLLLWIDARLRARSAPGFLPRPARR